MKHIKKICRSLTLLIIGFATPMHAIDFDLDSFDSIFDDPALTQFIDNTEFTTINRTIPPEDIVDTLIDLGVLDLLQEDFYLHTNPIQKRSLLDLPIFAPYFYHKIKDWELCTHLFWNQINKVNFTKNSTAIGSYLAVNKDSIIERLSRLIGLITPISPSFSISLKDIAPLIANMRVQERRIGFMFFALRNYKDINFRLQLPLYWFERNFFLNKQELSSLEDQLGASSPSEQDRFANDHLISDKFGIGDARIQIDYPVINRNDFHMRIGGQVTLPMAFHWAKGLRGNSFTKRTDRPEFSFKELFELGETGNSSENRQSINNLIDKILIGAFDQFSANILEDHLGNGGHIGIGGYINTEHPLSHFIKHSWAEKVLIRSHISLEYLFRSKDRRFFIELPNTNEFTGRDFSDPTKANENLLFLNEQFINKLFPFALETHVHPGIVFWWTTAAHMKKNNWSGHIGLDLWVKGIDSIQFINTPPSLTAKLDINKAKIPLALQFKLIGSTAYTIDYRDRVWILSLNIDKTFASRGIGKDFNFSFGIESTFN